MKYMRSLVFTFLLFNVLGPENWSVIQRVDADDSSTTKVTISTTKLMSPTTIAMSVAQTTTTTSSTAETSSTEPHTTTTQLPKANKMPCAHTKCSDWTKIKSMAWAGQVTCLNSDTNGYGWISYDDFIQEGWNQVEEITYEQTACELQIVTDTNVTLDKGELRNYPFVKARPVSMKTVNEFEQVTSNPLPDFRAFWWNTDVSSGRNSSSYYCSSVTSMNIKIPCNWLDHSIAMFNHIQKVDLKNERNLMTLENFSCNEHRSGLFKAIQESMNISGLSCANGYAKAGDDKVADKFNNDKSTCQCRRFDRCFQLKQKSTKDEHFRWGGCVSSIPEMLNKFEDLNSNQVEHYEHLSLCNLHEIDQLIEKNGTKSFVVSDTSGKDFHEIACCLHDCSSQKTD